MVLLLCKGVKGPPYRLSSNPNLNGGFVLTEQLDGPEGLIVRRGGFTSLAKQRHNFLHNTEYVILGLWVML